jgi:hypothetical protein
MIQRLYHAPPYLKRRIFMLTEKKLNEGVTRAAEELADSEEYREINKHYKSNARKLLKSLDTEELKYLLGILKSVEFMTAEIARKCFGAGVRMGLEDREESLFDGWVPVFTES